MKYSPVIGLEIHIQVKTNSKMFCRCSSNYFEKEPNTNICPVCFGLPGALPTPNKYAIEQCIKLALALNCSINKKTKFDRKNYFFPDLAKGYQISQFDYPVGYDGYIDLESGSRINIQRIHIEEDTAKSIHVGSSDESLIDYNKSGVALIEVVTKPDFKSVQDVLDFGKKLRQMARYTGVSDMEMQKGQARYELNISMKEEVATKLPDYKVEVKNIGSISVLEKVIEFEIKRQTELLSQGKTIKPQTRGLKDMSGQTTLQRSKETSDDYRYFPEPDIPAFEILESDIATIQKSIPELPHERKARYLNLGIESNQAEFLVESFDKGNWFDIFISEVNNDKTYVSDGIKWFLTEVLGIIEKSNKSLNEVKFTQKNLVEIIDNLKLKTVTNSGIKSILTDFVINGGNLAEIIKDNGLTVVNNDSDIENFAKQVLESNPNVVADISKNPNAIKFLVGQVMKLSKGAANPQKAEEILKKML